jgi:tetratricopeptide (TPR) repeat protein
MSAVFQVIESARALRADGRLADALEALAVPEEFSTDLCAARGAIEFALGHFSDAALSLSAIAVTRPDDACALYNLALCLERAQRWDAAAGAFERVLHLDPAREQARLALGACLLKMKHPQEALEEFEQIRRDRGKALFGKAVALHLLGRTREAAKTYEELLTMQPDSEEALANWIALSVEACDFEQVQTLAERLLAKAPRSKVALQGLAAVALERGDRYAAASYQDQFLESTPVETPPAETPPDDVAAWHNLRIAIEHAQLDAAKPGFVVHHGGNL